MFERMMERVTRTVGRRTQERIGKLAEEMQAAAPAGVRVAPTEEGVRLSGPALRRRFALDPALRWVTAALR